MSTDSEPLADDGTDDLTETTDSEAAVSILSSGTPLRSLVLKSDGDDDTTDTLTFPNAMLSDDGDGDTSSLFSVDSLRDMADAVKSSKADKLTVHWGDEFPTKLRFEQEEFGFNGTFLLAPRIGDSA